MFHTFFWCFYSYFELVNFVWKQTKYVQIQQKKHLTEAKDPIKYLWQSFQTNIIVSLRRSLSQTETSSLTCRADRRTGFYMIWTSVMKELMAKKVGSHLEIRRDNRRSELSDKKGLRLNSQCELKHLLVSLLLSPVISP